MPSKPAPKPKPKSPPKPKAKAEPLPDLKLTRGKNGRPQWRSVSDGAFTNQKRTLYLDCLAATCNVALSSRLAGIAQTNINSLRRRDAEFDAECQAALATGYHRLEAIMLERALAGQNGPLLISENPEEDGKLSEREDGEVPLPRPEAITNEQALRLLAHYQRTVQGVKAPSKRRGGPVRSMATEEETNAALVKRLQAIFRRKQKEAGDGQGADE